MELQIKKNEFIDWWLEDNDEALEIAAISLKQGHKPINEIVKSSKEFYAMCGYLPTRFIKNFNQLTEREKARAEDDEFDCDAKFTIKWV